MRDGIEDMQVTDYPIGQSVNEQRRWWATDMWSKHRGFGPNIAEDLREIAAMALYWETGELPQEETRKKRLKLVTTPDPDGAA